jgi:hypothetical protein
LILASLLREFTENSLGQLPVCEKNGTSPLHQLRRSPGGEFQHHAAAQPLRPFLDGWMDSIFLGTLADLGAPTYVRNAYKTCLAFEHSPHTSDLRLWCLQGVR